MVEAIARPQAAAGHRVTVYGSRLVCSSSLVGDAHVLALPALRQERPSTVLLRHVGPAHALLRGGLP